MASWVMVPSESVRCHGEVTPLLVCLLLMTLAWSRKSAICSSVSLGSEGLSEAARTPATRQHDNINTAIDRDRVRRSNMRKPPLEFYRCNAKDLYAQGGWVSRPKGFRTASLNALIAKAIRHSRQSTERAGALSAHVRVYSRPRTAVVRDTLVPHDHREREESRGNHRYQVEERREGLASQEMGGGIERSEAEGDDPAQHELDEHIVDGEGIAAEGQHVEHGRHDAYAVLEPERDGGEDQEHGEIDERAARHHEREPEVIGEMPGKVQALDADSDHQQTGHDFLQ